MSLRQISLATVALLVSSLWLRPFFRNADAADCAQESPYTVYCQGWQSCTGPLTVCTGERVTPHKGDFGKWTSGYWTQVVEGGGELAPCRTTADCMFLDGVCSTNIDTVVAVDEPENKQENCPMPEPPGDPVPEPLPPEIFEDP